MPICKCPWCYGKDRPEEWFSVNPKTGERYKQCDKGRKYRHHKYKPSENRREYNREWQYRWRRTEHGHEYYQKLEQTKKENVDSLLGSGCYFNKLGECRNRSGYKLIGHEKSGNGHDSEVKRILWGDPSRAPEFVHLCLRHHREVHAIINLLGFSWVEIDALVEARWAKQLQVA